MNKLSITARKDTPYICFDNDAGLFEISGKSLPEDAVIFYAPLLSWINNYMKAPQDKTIINIKFMYANTATSKKVIEMLKLFITAKLPEKELQINWFYKKDDEEQLEEGQDYSEMVKYPFNFIEYVKF